MPGRVARGIVWNLVKEEETEMMMMGGGWVGYRPVSIVFGTVFPLVCPVALSQNFNFNNRVAMAIWFGGAAAVVPPLSYLLILLAGILFCGHHRWVTPRHVCLHFFSHGWK
jgi:hypothetical protein